jgi:hypothetical protein
MSDVFRVSLLAGDPVEDEAMLSSMATGLFGRIHHFSVVVAPAAKGEQTNTVDTTILRTTPMLILRD